ncbi:hypothetical protein FIBSPDRAFT_937158 [Athelia psychrophila]|uniref:Uncharacterized protein n=1 Tax=Athelia psychrophila TaxID=1759441 RepID=A0A166AWE0_9AGAM|nr:hypothetical protein FIBSPDRAFT_937158 [Fibularhizoctonia sp. CBS 109695]
MSTDITPGAGGLRPPVKTTRTSLRQSLNLASMGKALADVMNKSDGRGLERGKKGKEIQDAKPVTTATHSRRASVASVASTVTAGGRSSVGSVKSPAGRRESLGDSKTATRANRRSSLMKPSISVEEQGVVTANESDTPLKSRVTRSSTLRTTAQTTALPKYRPKSVIVESTTKPATPKRAGIRRRLSTSEESTPERDMAKTTSPVDKATRTISPLPQRGSALKVNLSAAMNITPSTPDKKNKLAAPKTNYSPSKPAPRPTKATKTPPAVVAKSARPPSSASSQATPPSTPRTPKGPSSLRTAFGFGRSDGKGKSPLQVNRASPSPESPLAKHGRIWGTPTASNTASTSRMPRDESQDSIDISDVEMLLAPTASLSAPTPAIPRARSRRPADPVTTPTRSGLLPSRQHLSYLSPLPPTKEESPIFRPKQPGHEKGSLMSWDQLARQSTHAMTEEEGDSMITGVNLPFSLDSPRTPPIQLSPQYSPIQLSVPESPCLSALPSPGDYASISHVLLPEVTPSPAPHHELRYDNSLELPAVDAAIVTLLRLQLASAEHTARERLYQLQSLEEQLHRSKDLRLRDAAELARQVTHLEEQLHGSVGAREKADEERSMYTASLEDQLRHAEAYRDHAIEAAMAKAEEQALASHQAAMQATHAKWEFTFTAKCLSGQWSAIHGQAKDDLETIRGDRQTLSILLAGLEQNQQHICSRLS